MPVPAAAWSKASVYGCSLAGIVGLNTVRGIAVSLSVLSVVRCQVVGLINSPEESYRVWCV